MSETDDRARQNRRAIESYLSRRQLYPAQLADEPQADLGLVVVIPCYQEPDLIMTLVSLSRCDLPKCAVEVLIVLNHPESASMEVRDSHSLTRREFEAWVAQQPETGIRFHLLDYPALADRDAGVGLARKLGMDEAVARFARTQLAEGIIASLDADCVVRSDYLTSIAEYFEEHRLCPGVSIYFEHPLESIDEPALRTAIIDYELHLRYYVAGMRAAGFPFAFHTVGSAMACRAGTYARQGGMNRRQAGEDFYFIQKLVALGSYDTLVDTVVYPAARLSTRVPFGTGAALREGSGSSTRLLTYPVQVFRDLEDFCIVVGQSQSFEISNAGCSPALSAFLAEHAFETRLAEIHANVASPAAFNKRIYRWFNAFRFMKFANFARDRFYSARPVTEAAAELMQWIAPGEDAPTDTLRLLNEYRALDRRDPAGLAKGEPLAFQARKSARI